MKIVKRIAVAALVVGAPVAAMAQSTSGVFDASSAYSSLSPTSYGTSGALLLGAVLSVMIGIKWAKKIANKTT